MPFAQTLQAKTTLTLEPESELETTPSQPTICQSKHTRKDRQTLPPGKRLHIESEHMGKNAKGSGLHAPDERQAARVTDPPPLPHGSSPLSGFRTNNEPDVINLDHEFGGISTTCRPRAATSFTPGCRQAAHRPRGVDISFYRGVGCCACAQDKTTFQHLVRQGSPKHWFRRQQPQEYSIMVGHCRQPRRRNVGQLVNGYLASDTLEAPPFHPNLRPPTSFIHSARIVYVACDIWIRLVIPFVSSLSISLSLSLLPSLSQG
ncbi:hypothetical protein C8F01DRAFT_275567 [Mycena amicta]|nr:hypothetical protein C8F01DRAFT_275567 [Mycena amicta]